jgi:hypothetical protein
MSRPAEARVACPRAPLSSLPPSSRQSVRTHSYPEGLWEYRVGYPVILSPLLAGYIPLHEDESKRMRLDARDSTPLGDAS